tara:strand:+ start:3806 stop:4555 length:750 start_codon:yes stop_codon:yes gene_type:complete
MNNKTVVITGGNRGIGLDITKSFIQAGYKVFIGARQKTKVLEELGENAIFVPIDVRKESDHIKIVDEAIDQTGRLDTYVNNAGFSEWRPIKKIDTEFLEKIISTNLIGAFWGCKAALAVMKNGSTIINVSSIASKRGSANNSAYVATKFAMNGLTQSLAKEYGPKGIRINGVCPVLIETEGLMKALQNSDSPAAGDPKGFIDRFALENSALKRLPKGQEVAQMCVFLASNLSSGITAQNINVDCGVFPQ